MIEPKDIEQMYIPEFEAYIRQGEPDQKSKAALWQMAAGLQAVDGLQTSDYLRETARRNIEGEITLDEAHDLIHDYYHSRAAHNEPTNSDEEEADRASSNFATPTSTPTSTPSSNDILSELVRVIGCDELSVKQMMDYKGLKDRKNFMDYHLSPAIEEGFVRMKYPDSPRHPRQKYLLTDKGLALYMKLGEK